LIIVLKSGTGASRAATTWCATWKWASQGLSHYFSVESDELKLKMNVRVDPLSPHLAY
jgi:hypothetical protein